MRPQKLIKSFISKETTPILHKSLAARLVALKIQIDASKEIYKEYDRLLQVALEKGSLPSKITYQGTTWRLQVLDLFKDKNTAWKSVAQRRFDLVISK